MCVGQISSQYENLRKQRLPRTLFPGIFSPEQGGGSSSFIPKGDDEEHSEHGV